MDRNSQIGRFRGMDAGFRGASCCVAGHASPALRCWWQSSQATIPAGAVEGLGVAEVNNRNRARVPILAGLGLGIGSGAHWMRDLSVNSPGR